ncbi:WYL domain-containing protein [Hydrocarboniphaga sp.]|uniref:WYL domain-containing protein n=1 Tax=Hydrocarboniphaga sp. TaxID=2033016 RepID=UPI003D0F216D
MKDADKAAVIAAAIERKCRLQLDYDASSRVFEPHTLGVDASGLLMVCGYQVRGGSRTGQSSGWKTFSLGRVGELEVLEEHFGPHAEYRHNDPGFARIDAQL